MVYIHIPFCKSFCTYCDFYSEICSGKESAEVQNLFVSAICDEIERRREEINLCSSPATLYIGGGTPSVLDFDRLESIVKKLDCGPFEEFTIEVNPEDIVTKGTGYVRDLMALGVNRFSMGVQSTDDGILKWMNRRHNAAGAFKAYSILREAGAANISLDLIFGISIMSDGQWEKSIDDILALAPEHISAYQLSIEEGSALGAMSRKGLYKEADEQTCRSQYDLLCRKLAGKGYHHYEISNFALPGNEAVHNSAYWKRVPYVGIGPGAHSFDGQKRSWNNCSLTDRSTEEETLTGEDAATEKIMLSLRTDHGIGSQDLLTICKPEAVSRLESEGALVRVHDTEGTRLRIPEDHFFVSDEIIRELI